MMDSADQKRLMIQYLLGELSAADRAAFEDLYLNDSDLFQELSAVENEMSDQYVLGELPGAEREKFHQVYMTNPARREAVETAGSLLRYSAAQDATPPRTIGSEGSTWHRRWQLQIAAAAAFILVGGVLWLLEINHQLRDDIEKLRQDQITLVQDKQLLQGQNDRLRADLRDRNNILQQMEQGPAHGTVLFTLGAGASRGSDGVEQLVIPRGASYVLLRMVVEGPMYPRYGLSLATVEGSPIWHNDNIPGKSIKDETEIAVKMPTRLLRKNGDYVVRVGAGSGNNRQILAGYSFHVVRP
jgi:hypothetical protein